MTLKIRQVIQQIIMKELMIGMALKEDFKEK
jgi:hypothetical protein